MLNRHQIVLGFLLATALWAVYFVLQSDTSAYHQICETNQYTEHERCAPHHIPYVIAYYIGYWFDKASAVITAFATAFIASFTYTLWTSTRDQLIHNRRVERAYVKLSHRSPGITVHAGTELFEVTNVVKNFGQTPAEITDVVLTPLVLPAGQRLPAEPTYRRNDGGFAPQSFLVADEEFSYLRFYNVQPGQMNEVLEFRSILYFIGYVDYIDRFDRRHRAGYARQFAPRIDDRSLYRTNADFEARSNLVFVTDAGYNYDRPRLPGEGNDWE